MKNGEIIEKINRLNNRIIKNKETQERDIKKIKAEICEIEMKLNSENKDCKKAENAKIAFTGITGACVGAFAITLIFAFSVFMTNIWAFLAIAALSAVCGSLAYTANKNHVEHQSQVTSLNAQLTDANIRLFKKEHILETLDQRRENWYKRLDRELNRSKKNVSKNLPVRSKKTNTNKVNKNDEDLTK